MERITLSEIRQQLRKTELIERPELNLTILRNITLEAMKPYLQYMAYQMGFRLNDHWGDYDMIMQDAMGGNDELLNDQTDGILIFTNLETLAPDLSRNFASLSDHHIQSERQRIQQYIESVIAGIRKQTNGMILWHGFENPANPNLGILDAQTAQSQPMTIAQLNEDLRALLQSTPNAYFVDMNRCLTRIGSNNFYDWRYWHIGRAPYTDDAHYEIANTDFQYIKALKGRNKKCLILDCDNVLWGGIVGEDGVAGIKLSKNYPGSPYYEFQQEVVNLYHRGVIIALCSKNNEEDVMTVFEEHPDMLLKKEHIVAHRINWQDKASNIRAIAEELNIGIDSLVFIDDSDFEVNLVRQALPEVTVIHLPPTRAVENRATLASCGLFESLTLSKEDKNRGEMYKAEIERTKIKESVTDLAEYYKSLEMELEVRLADDFSIPRIAQLTQKTNQFNLTTQRYSEAEIKEFCQNKDSDILYAKLTDRFGDSGIIGVCLLKHQSDQITTIDSFLLSCRVLGRGVEDAFLTNALHLAKNRGNKIVEGIYIPTRKNKQTQDFYTKQKFTRQSETNVTERVTFLFNLKSPIPKEQSFFKNIESDIIQNEEVLL